MERLHLLDAILKMTDEMSDAAEQGEWEKLAEHERERLKLIHDLFEQPVPETESEQVKEAIEKVIAADKEILSKAASAKDVIHGQAKQLSVEKRAFEEYAKNR